MTPTHVDRIREQFTRQSEAYAKLAYVSDDKGLARIVALSGAEVEHHVLDVACGPGFLTMAFADVCQTATGIDATEAFLDMARAEAARRATTNVSFLQGNVESMDLPDAAYDVVLCRAAFHHFPDPEKVLSEMVRVCQSGGTVCVIDMVASEDADKAAYHHELETLCDPTHARALSDSAFRALFDAYGLRVSDARSGKTVYTLDDWIGHGCPRPEHEARIRELVTACIEEDRCGLPVWEEDGQIFLAHPGTAYILRRS